jgi:hypothetical protein
VRLSNTDSKSKKSSVSISTFSTAAKCAYTSHPAQQPAPYAQGFWAYLLKTANILFESFPPPHLSETTRREDAVPDHKSSRKPRISLTTSMLFDSRYAQEITQRTKPKFLILLLLPAPELYQRNNKYYSCLVNIKFQKIEKKFFSLQNPTTYFFCGSP